jgi:hypothetical protein
MSIDRIQQPIQGIIVSKRCQCCFHLQCRLSIPNLQQIRVEQQLRNKPLEI